VRKSRTLLLVGSLELFEQLGKVQLTRSSDRASKRRHVGPSHLFHIGSYSIEIDNGMSE